MELVPTSEYGATTDIRRAPGQEHVIGPVLLSSARIGRSTNTKTVTEAAAVLMLCDSVYVFILRRAKLRPARPKLNRARVVGSGTVS
jgi:hypothetical protein